MSTATITQQQIKRLTDDLTRLAEAMMSTEHPAAITVDRAAVMLESLRLGLTAVQPPIWIGIDMGAQGGDKTGRFDFHA